jgi:hypothetical protein
VFVTSSGHAYAELQRALTNGNLWVAEAVARDLPRPLSLRDALQLVHLHTERGSPKFEPKAARHWFVRYLEESSPELENLRRSSRAWRSVCPDKVGAQVGAPPNGRRLSRELKRPCFQGLYLTPRVRLERTTLRLTAGCSAN